MYGSAEVRTDAAACIAMVAEYSTLEAIQTEVTKITGALIRVANDKFPQETKRELFNAILKIQEKAGAKLKVMVPQLQTTFVKNFNDRENESEVRALLRDNAVLFMSVNPRVDNIVKDLLALVAAEEEKFSGEEREHPAETLAAIVRLFGRKLSSQTSILLADTIHEVLERPSSDAFSGATRMSLALVLAALSAYAEKPAEGAPQEAAQEPSSPELFTAFDGEEECGVPIAIKFGMLLAGAEVDAGSLEASFYPRLEKEHASELLRALAHICAVFAKPSLEAKAVNAAPLDSDIYLSFLGRLAEVLEKRKKDVPRWAGQLLVKSVPPPEELMSDKRA